MGIGQVVQHPQRRYRPEAAVFERQPLRVRADSREWRLMNVGCLVEDDSRHTTADQQSCERAVAASQVQDWPGRSGSQSLGDRSVHITCGGEARCGDLVSKETGRVAVVVDWQRRPSTLISDWGHLCIMLQGTAQPG